MRKIFCLFMVVLMLINAMPVTAAPSVETNANSAVYYKNQISTNSKGIYEALVEYYYEDCKTGTMKYIFPDGGLKIEAKDSDEFFTKIKKIYVQATEAFLMDYPQVFWIKNFNASVSRSYDGNDIYNVEYIKLIPKELYENGADDIDEYFAGVEKAARVIKKKAGSNATQYDLLCAIHDYMCSKLVYSTEGEMTTSSAALFCKKEKTVCEGYSKAFKVLCDYFGIDCIIVAGELLKGDKSTLYHKWNYVELNNKWYLVDLACDDQKDKIEYDFFLVGKKSKGFYYKISKSHVTRADYWRNGVKKFTYPTLNNVRYKATNKTKINTLRYKYKNIYTYNGNAKSPNVKIRDGRYLLKKGKDYTITYRNNVEIGSAKIIIRGKGKYKGRKILKYTII